MSTETPEDSFDPMTWLQDCPVGELRSIQLDGTVLVVDRRPIAIVQDAGASSEQHLHLAPTPAQPVMTKKRDGEWVDLTLAELLDRAPDPDKCHVYREYMEMVCKISEHFKKS